MKQINRYRVYGTVSVDVCVEVDAPTMEDAIAYAEDNYRMEEYSNGTVGIEDRDYNFSDGEVTCCCEIEWQEDCSELVEEDVEDENEIWNDEEDDEDEE